MRLPMRKRSRMKRVISGGLASGTTISPIGSTAALFAEAWTRMRGKMRLSVAVICLVGSILAGCIPEFGQRERQAKLELGQIRSALNEYRKRTARFPAALADMAPPTCRKDCTLVELRADPWGSEYAFASDGGSG